jgi:hypothetical protein
VRILLWGAVSILLFFLLLPPLINQFVPVYFHQRLGLYLQRHNKIPHHQALPPSGVADTILLSEGAYETAPGYMEKVSPAGGRLW